ncbi:hypothetical protein EBB79_08845 [Parasedimentitalea marina]|uniref:Uncharacterized protein n=1 Tax=Parasedimentitalea marina TaxID=2483033 RepID=A0A3T0N1W9_9RHOB|nr:hypothetical protein [Parasedimentitalea marina]AZV77991.1 hypothetical protein EBB79_08845 [Parasedimentitalea marina]
MNPSLETIQFLNDLAKEHVFSDKAVTSTNQLVARNWANRAIQGDTSWMEYDAYSNIDELKYMTGVMLSAMFQMNQRLGYRDSSDYSLSWDEAKSHAVWRVVGNGTQERRLWSAGGGYMIATAHETDDTSFHVVFPQEFVDAILAILGSDLRSLEGAFGLTPYALDQNPQIKFYFFDSVKFTLVIGQQVDIELHFLSKTGVGDNRWPVRATILPKESCRILTITADKIDDVELC